MGGSLPDAVLREDVASRDFPSRKAGSPADLKHGSDHAQPHLPRSLLPRGLRHTEYQNLDRNRAEGLLEVPLFQALGILAAPAKIELYTAAIQRLGLEEECADLGFYQPWALERLGPLAYDR